MHVSESEPLVRLMNDCIAHRGPDDEGFFVEDKVGLGHRRLSIIDLSEAGHQPMFSSDERYAIVYNGELYNYREIKLDLQRVGTKGGESYDFRTQTDTEVIIAAYHAWGVDCLRRFNGMFAFALYDRQTKKLFIARDRIGKKPLYYHYKDQRLSFASELRAILSDKNIERKTTASAITDFLAYQTVHAPNTIIRDVNMLMPGHYLLADEQGIKIEKYWDLFSGLEKAVSEKPLHVIRDDIFRLLANSVERRLIADVPFGAFLSGGIDSSAIVGLMSRVMGKEVRTFSIVFDDPAFTEAQYSQLVSKHFGTKHTEINLQVTDLLKFLPEALDDMDHPSGDGPNTWLVSKATREAGVSMALSGLGGDELFAGYDIFKRSVSLKNKMWLNAFPASLRSVVGEFIRHAKPGVGSDKMAALLKKNSISFYNAYPLGRLILDERDIRKLFPLAVEAKSVENIISEFKSVPDDFTLTRVSMSEFSTYMQNVLLRDTDQMSMAHALEIRVPFLDYKLVEYVLSVPDKYKYPYTPKKLLVDSLGDLLPPEVVNRPKMGFTFPWKTWMKNDLKNFCQENLFSLPDRAGLDKRQVEDLWNRFLKDDKSITWSRVWHLVVLGYWLRKNNVSL